MNGPFGPPGGSPLAELDRHMRDGWMPRGHIDGWTISNDSGDTVNDVGIAAGSTRSTVNAAKVYNNAYSTRARDQRDIEIDDAVIKQLDVPWVYGNGGGRSSATLADGTWHCLAIGGKGLRDSAFFHNSITQSSVLAAMPSGYTAYRRVASVVRLTTILAFTQTNDLFQWSTIKADVSSGAISATEAFFTLTVPIGLKLIANINYNYADGDGDCALITSPNVTNEAVSVTANANVTASTSVRYNGQGTWQTDVLGRVRVRATGSALIYLNTTGYVDPRGRDS